ncbi:MAG: ECF-type sigma factor, partial [Planctomycetota bacterium]
MTESDQVSHWIERLKAGESEAANQIWHLYFDRLVRSVRQRQYGWRFAFFGVMAVNVVSLFARLRLLTTNFGAVQTSEGAPLTTLFKEQ